MVVAGVAAGEGFVLRGCWSCGGEWWRMEEGVLLWRRSEDRGVFGMRC